MHLRVALVSSLLHPCYGGPPSVVWMHANALQSHIDVTVIGCAPNGKKKEVEGLFPGSNIFMETWPRRWFRGKGLRNFLLDVAGQFDVFHAHMLWDHPVFAVWLACKKMNKPFIITPHGSLSSQWRYKAFHKRVYRRLVIDRILRDATFVHVLNSAEEMSCREYGIKCPIRVIPNALPTTDFEQTRLPDLAYQKWPNLCGRRVLLYLGRLWSGKGLDMLTEAWAEVIKSPNSKDWLFVITGPDYRNYRSHLISRINALGINHQILLTEVVSGGLKDALLAAAETFILPSISEGFSLTLLEAMSAGLPAIYTTECHFPELAACGGGWEIPINKSALVQRLITMTKMDPVSLNEMGRKGRILGREQYTLERITLNLLDMYKEAVRK